MQVVAISGPGSRVWQWRIVSYAGDVIEESRDTFPTIATAVARGRVRMLEINIVDTSMPVRPFRSTSHLRTG